MVSRFERFIFAFSEISRCWHKIAAEELEKYGLKGPYAIYLITLKKHPDGITAAQLSEVCGRDKSDVSRAINTMEKSGLIKKEAVNQSLYRAKIKLTAQGIEAADYVFGRANLAVNLAGDGLTDENREIMYEALELIASNLRNVSENSLPD